jgi:5-methylcytosine-specific restriction endonuclease McrA
MIRYDNSIKRPFEEFAYGPDEINEIIDCSKDIRHFLKHVRVVHPDRGIIPYEPYHWQDNLIDQLQENRFNVILASRQSGKSLTVSIFALHYAIFSDNKTIGIVSNKEISAKRILKIIKEIYKELPSYLKPGVITWNKTSIEFDNGSSIIVSATSPDAFRGATINMLICLGGENYVEILNKFTNKEERINIEYLYERLKKIDKFIKRNKRRNKHLYDFDESMVDDKFVVCPVTNERLSMIKKNYIEKILNIKYEDFLTAFPSIKLICNDRIKNIKNGINEVVNGITKHQTGIINSRRMIKNIYSDDKKEYMKQWRLSSVSYELYKDRLFSENIYNNNGTLEVSCTYCGKNYIPTALEVSNRINCLYTSKKGDSNFYCSQECKNNCSIYNQTKYPKGYNYHKDLTREVQPELRKMVFLRDEHTCQKCNADVDLHCHHIESVSYNPIESADIDNCITLCKKCHIFIHKNDCLTIVCRSKK